MDDPVIEFEYKVITGDIDGLEGELNGLAHLGWALACVQFDSYSTYRAVLEREVIVESEMEGPSTPFPQPHPAPQPGPERPKNYHIVNRPWQCGMMVYQDDTKVLCSRPVGHSGFCAQ